MSKKKTILYDNEYLIEIYNSYNKCISILQDMETNNMLAKSEMKNNYFGRANDLTEDTFNKFSQHFLFLEACCDGIKNYVDDSRQTLEETDKSISPT